MDAIFVWGIQKMSEHAWLTSFSMMRMGQPCAIGHYIRAIKGMDGKAWPPDASIIKFGCSPECGGTAILEFDDPNIS